MTELPTELLLDILARLPVNTMMQCKNVCRSWRDMVSTPYSGNKKSQYDCDIHSLSSITACFVSRKLKTLIKISKLYIYNPITGEHVEIPGPEVEQGQVALTQPGGFYYSSQSHQCTILINRPWGIDIPGQIFTGSNTWRKIDIPGRRYCDKWIQTVFVNGALHWVTVDNKHNRDNQYICSFDMENEQTRSTAPPGQIDMKTASLVLLGDFLCQYDAGFPAFDIWLMKEHGVKEYMEDGSILLSHGSISTLTRKYSKRLSSYDPKTEEIKSTISDWRQARFFLILHALFP
ncbi:hypothetical protein Peur_002243 [Populus x canadensis]